ncbi:MAG: TIGR02281 family clan AA aspartic protease [Gammaproteobacteria bacterium]|nr:TIGR02281 family clan AA aspartic protease [Gammaproteobacteria bacterium]
MRSIGFFLLGMFVFAVLSAINNRSVAGVIYKCKNREGILVYQNSACREDAETLTSWEHKDKPKPAPVDETQDEEAKKRASTVLKLSQNASGHFSTSGKVDGQALTFVVDTGASVVALPQELATSANIACDKTVDMTTANGNSDGCAAKVKELSFGPYLIKDVDVVVMPNLSQPLLGMNVLQAFNVVQEKGEMKISIMPQPDATPSSQSEDQAASL